MYGTSKPKWNSETNACEACPDGTPTWSGTECIACPSTTPAWNGSACVACTSTDTSYCEGLGQACDTSTQTCKSCFDVYNTAKPYWNSETGACEACPSATPKWNSSSGACVACPSTTPAWNGSECVACTSTDTSYCEGLGQACDTSTQTCKSCFDVYNTAKPYWNSETGACEACPAETPDWDGMECVFLEKCESNDDCDENQYCRITSYAENGSCTVGNSNYFIDLKGVCVDKGTLGSGYDVRFTTGTRKVWQTNEKLTWWGAKNWCAAHGKKLMDIKGTKLGCYKNGTVWDIQINSDTDYCMASGGSSQSMAIQDLQNAFGSDLNWTATAFYEGDNSCYVYFVGLDSGVIGYDFRDGRGVSSDYLFALCEDECLSSDECPSSKPMCNPESHKCEACPRATPKWNGSACEVCPEETPAWDGTQCAALKECVSNEDCDDEDKYCDIISYETNGRCSSGVSDYYTDIKGVCKEKGSVGEAHPIQFNKGSRDVWGSSETMTWWGAKNWCKAHNKKLLSIKGTKLLCYRSDFSYWSIIPGSGTGYCMSFMKSRSSSLSQQSVAMQDLRRTFGSVRSWTETNYYTGDDPCYSYMMCLNRGEIVAGLRETKGIALCESECLSSSDCPAVNPMCNLTTHQCEACPSTAPILDNNACVACTSTDTSYCEGLGQVCDISTQTCKSCYEMNTAEPKWNSETKMCEACPDGTDYYAAENLCIKAEFCPITVDPPFQFLPLSDLRCTGSDLFEEGSSTLFASFVAPTSCVDPVIVKNEISSMTIEGLGKVIVSKNSMSGIDTERFCQNMGLTRLQISATDLQCYADDGVTPFAYEDLSEPVIVSEDGSAEGFDLRISFIAPVNISEPLDVIDNFDDPNGNGDGDIDSPIIPEDSEFIKDGVLKAYSCCAAGQDCSGDISKQSLVMQRIRTAVENNSDAFADGYKCFWLGESGGCQSYGVSFFDAANGKMMRAPYINGIFCHAVCH